MDAVKFIEERNRMCGTMSEVWGVDAAQIVKNTEEWSAAHPRKTRQSVFLKMFPHVILNDKGQPGYCPKMLDTEYKPVGDCVLDVDTCQRCMDKFWGQEVE